METSSKAITVEVTVNAPIAKVWTSWNEPSHIMNWAFASPEWHAPYADNDPRTGGKFKTTMAARDGSMAFDFEGVYTKVDDHKEIAYAMADGRTARILFAAEGDVTRVTETFDPEDTNPEEMQRAGWQAILDNFKQYTETAAF
jgi:uncharacterized protein YndB with AHSA1/START domain